jgi:Na+-transporting methylmalonyl-CoA/oxaloacetate decarboxylase gamma subunit
MENMVLGVELLVIGMGTVVLSLYLLSVFLFFSGKLFGPQAGEKKKDKAAKGKKKSAVKNTKEKPKKLDRTEGKENHLSSAKIAAVSAAVYEMLADKKNYRIISIQKSNDNWKR